MWAVQLTLWLAKVAVQGRTLDGASSRKVGAAPLLPSSPSSTLGAEHVQVAAAELAAPEERGRARRRCETRAAVVGGRPLSTAAMGQPAMGHVMWAGTSLLPGCSPVQYEGRTPAGAPNITGIVHAIQHALLLHPPTPQPTTKLRALIHSSVNSRVAAGKLVGCALALSQGHTLRVGVGLDDAAVGCSRHNGWVLG